LSSERPIEQELKTSIRGSEVSTTQHATESGIVIATKAAPPVSVSLASFAGYQVSEILLWATLIYTVLMIGHKLYQIYKDVTNK
jgi:hypothetical protein